MNVNHVLQMRQESAVERFRQFLADWWLQNNISAMLAPVETPGQPEINLRAIEEPAEIHLVNPFAPIMLVNGAALVQDFLREYGGGGRRERKRLALLLRPCELRTLVELQKRRRIPAWMAHPGASGDERAQGPQVITIGVDCPGTYAVKDFASQVVEQGVDGLTRQILQYGAVPGYTPTYLRRACQVCEMPSPSWADIQIGAIGIAPQGYLLVIARDEQVEAQQLLDGVTDGLATEAQVVQRETAISALINQHRARRRRLLARSALLSESPLEGQVSFERAADFGRNPYWVFENNLLGVLGLFARCSLCADCLDACPLYDGELSGMLGIARAGSGGRALLAELVNLSRWLASCSGCGMCLEACENENSLAQLFETISYRIRGELHYQAGDPSQPLPWQS